MYRSCEHNPGYDEFDPREAPEPEEDAEATITYPDERETFDSDEFNRELEVYFDLLEEKGRPFPIHLLQKCSPGCICDSCDIRR